MAHSRARTRITKLPKAKQSQKVPQQLLPELRKAPCAGDYDFYCRGLVLSLLTRTQLSILGISLYAQGLASTIGTHYLSLNETKKTTQVSVYRNLPGGIPCSCIRIAKIAHIDATNTQLIAVRPSQCTPRPEIDETLYPRSEKFPRRREEERFHSIPIFNSKTKMKKGEISIFLDSKSPSVVAHDTRFGGASDLLLSYY
jgi:hypothetical protein